MTAAAALRSLCSGIFVLSVLYSNVNTERKLMFALISTDIGVSTWDRGFRFTLLTGNYVTMCSITSL